MKKLIHGIVDFRKQLTEEKRALFAKLAVGQKPDALFIACSDSRVAPNVFASTDPGDLFVLRNVGNLVPPASSEELSPQAALEFAVHSLNISDIIVCGHSECGAMHALLKGVEASNCSHLASWLKYGEKSLQREKTGVDPSLSEVNQLSQANVLQQMEHIRSYAFRDVHVHGWWFDIALAEVYTFEPKYKQFVLIEE